MQLLNFGITFSIAFLCLSGVSQAAQSTDPLSILPAEPQQTEPPQWVNAVPPYPLTLFSKAEVDLNSVTKRDDGQITAWARETYEEIQNPSTHYAFQISETNYLIDCDEGKYTALAINTRSINGNLVKSAQMPDSIQKDLTDIPPASLISAEVTLACAQAKKNWPSEEYELNIKQKRVSEITPLTSQQKEKINQAIVQQKESDKRNTLFAEPMLTAQGGRNICHKMNGVDGNPSPYELCYAQGMFSQSIYSVRANDIPILQEIDDNVTKGIDGTFNGSPIRLQCKPVHQLADDVTNKTIEDFILLNRASSKKFSFDDELKFAISINVIEIGRHCTLSNTDGVIAKLDVASP